MKIFESLVITSQRGEQVLIMLSKEGTDRERLHHYLSIDAFDFKKHVAEKMPEIEYVSTGILNGKGNIEWSEKYLELPKWYDLN
jgi:hypothetical protein